MKYDILEVTDKTTKKRYCIREWKTKQVLIVVERLGAATAIREILNKGSGFQGNTPSFFVNKKDQKLLDREKLLV